MVQGGIAKAGAVCLCALSLLLAIVAPAPASVYFGAAIAGETYGEKENAPLNEGAWDLFERHAGKRVAILNQGWNWGSFEKGMVDTTAARGAIPLVTMGLDKEMTLHDITDGSQDATIKKWAQAAKAWGKPFFFAPWWEMNGNWYAWGRSPEFIDAWRRFHDLVVGQGATNVTWTWVVNSIWSDPESKKLDSYYPGDEYVDWVGLDSYNWGLNPAQPDRWITPDQTLTPTLEILDEVAPAKPVAIVEDASSEYGGDKADWIREMLTQYLPHHPEIGAYLWFNWNFPKNGFHSDWPIESSAPAQQEFRRDVQSSYFLSGPLSLSGLAKVTPPGAALGGSTEAADLSPAGEVVDGSDVAVAADGTSTVVWSARLGGDFQVFARRIAADGTRGAIQQLSASGQDALAPQVAVAPDGTATVAWVRSDGTNFLVQARRIAPNGTPEESTKNLSTTGQNAAEPQVAVAPDGTSTVVWKRFDGSHYLAQERRVASDGTREASFHTLSEAKGDAVEPEVAAGPDGSATVVWSRYDGSNSIIQERRIETGGEPAAATLGLSSTGGNAIEPEVAVAGDGTATVAWDRFDGANWIVQARRLSAAGLPEGGAVSLSAGGGDAAEPQLALAQDGAATVVWDRFDGASFVVQARRLEPGGEPAGAAVDLSAAGRDAAEPAVAIAPNGTATALWSRFDGAAFLVQRRDLAGGALSTTETLSTAGHSASHPALAWGDDGTLAMTWNRFNGSADVVQAKTVPLPPPPVITPEGGSSGQSSGSAPKPGPAVDNAFSLGHPRLNRRLGTATLPVTVPGAGEISLWGAVPQRRHAAGAETLRLRIVPRSAKRRLLKHRGSLRLRVSVVFEPAGGTASSRALTVRLQRNRG